MPQGRGQEYKEGEAVEEENNNTEQHDGSDFKGKKSLFDIEVEVAAKDVLKSEVVVQRANTNVKSMSVEQIVEHVEQEVQQLSEAKEDVKQSEAELQQVQHVRCSSSIIREGHAAALKQAVIMFRQSTVLYQEDVVNHHVPEGVSQKGNRLLAQSFVEDVFEAWDTWVASEESKHGVSISSNGGKVLRLAKKELCSELAQGVHEFKHKYLEDGPGQTE